MSTQSQIFLTPAIKLAGQPLPTAWEAALLEVRVERQFQVPGRLTMRFADPGYELLASNTLSAATALEVDDPGGTQLIQAEVTGIAVDQRPGEQPELVVVAHDKSHRLARQTVAKSYSSMAYSDIVSAIAGDADLRPSVTASTGAPDPYLMQADSDLGLLTELARRVGADWWVDGQVLHFGPPTAGNQVSLTLGDGLRSFSARATAQPPTSVQVAGWDRTQQAVVNGTATSATSAVLASSTLANFSTNGSAFGAGQLFTAGLGVQSNSEAGTLSQAILDRNAAGAVRAQGVSDGSGLITLGSVVSVGGAGPLSGTYPVTRVEHAFRPSSGFVTRFFCGDRQPTMLVDTLAGPGGGAARPAFSQFGLTVGTVTNVNDPNNTGMVKVRYPGLGDQYETGWARVASVGGGASRGGVFVPEVDDEVLIGFECADPRRPVVIAGLYGAKSTIPTPTISDGKVQSRTLTSRLGHSVSLLDGTSDAQQAIELQLAGQQHVLHIGKDKVTLTVPGGLEVTVTAGNSSLSFGTDGSVSVSAPQISLTGSQKVSLSAPQIEISASAQLTLEGNGSAALKGGAVQVQGTGSVSVQGTMVSIN